MIGLFLSCVLADGLECIRVWLNVHTSGRLEDSKRWPRFAGK